MGEAHDGCRSLASEQAGRSGRDDGEALVALHQVTGFCIRRRWTVVAVWLAVLVGGLAGAGELFGRLDDGGAAASSSESARASARLAALSPAGASVVAVADGLPVTDPGLRAGVARVTAALRSMPEVLAVTDGISSPDPRLVATDGRAVAVTVTLHKGLHEAFRPTVDRVAAELRTLPAPRVLLGGETLQDREMSAQAEADLVRAELLSLPVVLVLLLVVFGGFVAAGLPLLVALVGVAGALGVLLGVSTVLDLSPYAVNVVTMLGLGLAVDYALLVVSRFREERGLRPDAGIPELVHVTAATAGRTVAFSGLTVAVALAALLVFDDPFLRSMAAGGIGVVLADVAAALTLLPAVLALVGRRIRGRVPSTDRRGVFVVVARAVRRRPVVVTLWVGAALALLAVPFAGVRYADADARSLPPSSQARQLATLAETRFGEGAGTDPLVVVATRPVTTSERQALSAWVEQVRALPGVVAAVPRALPVDVPPVLDVTPQGRSQGEVARSLVASVRALPSPVPVEVTGDAARLVDRQQSLADRAPWAVAILLGATFVLLFLFTGSLIVPLKALVMNTLSLGAAFGALVWVFQDGHLAHWIGTEALGAIDLQTPLLVLAIAFGLSMDYEVFLLSRIQEQWRATGDNALAVERGLQASGRIVTSAALLLVVVFAGFVAGGFAPVKQVGLGLTLAVVLDATVVRMLLVPATMTLLGRLNWWAPAPLARWHARHGLREEPASVLPEPALTPA